MLMVKMEDAVVARFSSSGEKFEILVDPYLAMDLKHGKEINFDELLASDTVYKDAAKGEEKGEEGIKSVFGTLEIQNIAKKIIEDGDVQLTTNQRRQLIENRKKELVDSIARNAINPQTNAPHPPQRIQNAIEEANIHIDLNKSFNEQVATAVREIKKLLPLSMEKMQVAIKVPSTFAAKANSILHKYDLKKEEWQSDGSLITVVEIPAGMKNELFGELNSLTHGDIETKILEKNG